MEVWFIHSLLLWQYLNLFFSLLSTVVVVIQQQQQPECHKKIEKIHLPSFDEGRGGCCIRADVSCAQTPSSFLFFLSPYTAATMLTCLFFFYRLFSLYFLLLRLTCKSECVCVCSIQLCCLKQRVKKRVGRAEKYRPTFGVVGLYSLCHRYKARSRFSPRPIYIVSPKV